LWHYIDLVRGMEGVWDPVNELIRLTQDAEQLRYNLREVHKVGRNGTFENMSLSEILDYIDEPINKFLKASKHVGVAALKEKNRSRH
jgi:hypothetical protein